MRSLQLARGLGLLGPILLIAVIVWVDRSFLRSKVPVFLGNTDNLFSYYSMWFFFLDGLRHGVIAFYQPFLWAGTRVFGDPDFKVNLVQVVTGILFGPDTAYFASNYMLLVERAAAALGFYALTGAICPKLNRPARVLLSLVYVFSNGYAYFQAFHNLSIALATTPWSLYFLTRQRSLWWPAAFGGLTLSLFVAFSYSQLQMTIYSGWLILSFLLFWIPRSEKRSTFVLLVLSGATAAALSAYFIIPLIDNLYFGDSVSGRVTGTVAHLAYEQVPWFFLLRLFVPWFFGPAPWWPIWQDGWTILEAFSAFQGTIVAILAIFGLFIRRVPLYFRALYVFVIASVTTWPGLWVSYVLNLGTAVNYGRQTVFLALVAPIVAAFALQAVLETPKLAWRFATLSALYCAIFAAVYTFGVPKAVVLDIFAHALAEFPNANVTPEAASTYYAGHFAALRESFGPPALFAGLAALAGAAAWSAAGRRRQLVTSILMVGMFAAAALDAEGVYRMVRASPSAAEQQDPPTYTLHHPLEDALIADHVQVRHGPIDYRLHIDIYFGEQWSGAVSTLRLVGARPAQNRFRLMPNFLAGDDFPVTTGYSSVIPDALPFTQMMFSMHLGHMLNQRAIGERVQLRPSMLEAFAVKWVLRHQPSVTAGIDGGAPDKSDDPWEKRFETHSTLIYQDDAYRLYEYRDARPAIDIPDRVAFGNNPVATFEKIERSDGPWIPTAALPQTAMAGLGANLRARLQPENGVEVLHQSGKVVQIRGEAGRWTDIVANADQPAFLLLGVKYDRWWRVWINGKPTPLIRANGAFSAVQIPAGRSEISVRLRPISAWVGLGLSGLATVIFLAVLVIGTFRGRGAAIDRAAIGHVPERA